MIKRELKKKNETIVDNWIRCFGMQKFKTKNTADFHVQILQN